MSKLMNTPLYFLCELDTIQLMKERNKVWKETEIIGNLTVGIWISRQNTIFRSLLNNKHKYYDVLCQKVY